MFLGGALICLAQMALADQPVERAPLTPGGLIRLSNSSGDVMIEGWDRREVEVTVQPAGEASRQIPGVRLEQPSDGELKIGSIAPPSRRFAGRYHIFAPRDSRLAIDHRSGFIFVSGVTGDLDIRTRRGDIVLMLPNLASYSIDARDKFGIVSSDSKGLNKHCCVLGERFASDSSPGSHHLRLRMGFGGITLKNLPPETLPK